MCCAGYVCVYGVDQLPCASAQSSTVPHYHLPFHCAYEINQIKRVVATSIRDHNGVIRAPAVPLEKVSGVSGSYCGINPSTSVRIILFRVCRDPQRRLIRHRPTIGPAGRGETALVMRRSLRRTWYYSKFLVLYPGCATSASTCVPNSRSPLKRWYRMTAEVCRSAWL